MISKLIICQLHTRKRAGAEKSPCGALRSIKLTKIVGSYARSTETRSLYRSSRSSASPIGGVAPRRDQQRNMVVGSRIADGEADRHHVEKRRVRELRPLLAEIVSCVKDELE